MPTPTAGTATLRPDLGVVAYAYAADAAQRGFIGLKVLPIFESGLPTGSYPVIPAEAFLKRPNNLSRAPRSAYSRSDFQFKMQDFNCKEYGHEALVDERERKMYEAVHRGMVLDMIATKRGTHIMLQAQEMRIAAKVMNTSNYPSSNVVPAAKVWTSASDTDPKADVTAGITLMENTTGLTPNALCITKVMARAVLNSAHFRETLKYTTPLESLPWDAKLRLLAAYFEVEEVLMSNAIYDAAGKGKAINAQPIWDNTKALLARIATDPLNLEEPCLGRSFLDIGDSPQNLVVESYYETQTRSDVYRVRHDTDECFMFTNAGYVITGISA